MQIVNDDEETYGQTEKSKIFRIKNNVQRNIFQKVKWKDLISIQHSKMLHVKEGFEQ